MSGKIKYLIAGTGININQENFVSNAPNPVSLKQLTGTDYDLDECLKILLEDINKRYLDLINGKGNTIIADYHSCLFRKNEWISFSDDDGPFRGRIKKVATDGKISIETASGDLRNFYFKEVEFMPENRGS